MNTDFMKEKQFLKSNFEIEIFYDGQYVRKNILQMNFFSSAPNVIPRLSCQPVKLFTFFYVGGEEFSI